MNKPTHIGNSKTLYIPIKVSKVRVWTHYELDIAFKLASKRYYKALQSKRNAIILEFINVYERRVKIEDRDVSNVFCSLVSLQKKTGKSLREIACSIRTYVKEFSPFFKGDEPVHIDKIYAAYIAVLQKRTIQDVKRILYS